MRIVSLLRTIGGVLMIYTARLILLARLLLMAGMGNGEGLWGNMDQDLFDRRSNVLYKRTGLTRYVINGESSVYMEVAKRIDRLVSLYCFSAFSHVICTNHDCIFAVGIYTHLFSELPALSTFLCQGLGLDQIQAHLIYYFCSVHP